jgi:hypothetical protein
MREIESYFTYKEIQKNQNFSEQIQKRYFY